MKLIRTRPSAQATAVEKQPSLSKGPTSPTGASSQDQRKANRTNISQGRQPSLSISSN